MRLVEILEGRKQALRVNEVANLFCVTPQHIYKMAAQGSAAVVTDWGRDPI